MLRLVRRSDFIRWLLCDVFLLNSGAFLFGLANTNVSNTAALRPPGLAVGHARHTLGGSSFACWWESAQRTGCHGLETIPRDLSVDGKQSCVASCLV